MVCGNAAMEAITSITKAMATQFQMQHATNCSRPLPFPTVKEGASLKRAYDMAPNRGRPSAPTINSLVREMRMEVKEIKGWFTDERKAQGNVGHGWATLKEMTPSRFQQEAHVTTHVYSHFDQPSLRKPATSPWTYVSASGYCYPL